MVDRRVLFIFVDGIGVGKKSENNPFSNPKFEILSSLAGGDTHNKDYIFQPIDASLNLDGIPQSATGQTALFTGINPIPVVGNHITGVPNLSLRNVINESSIFKILEKIKISCRFANAYHKEYFLRDRRLYSATTWSVMAMENPHFNYVDDLKKGNAVFADITNEFLINEGYDLQLFSPEKAASVLLNLMKQYRFVLYEIPFLDRLGHKLMISDIQKNLEILERFLKYLNVNRNNDNLIFLTSDHGNIEDLSKRSHTNNPVPLFIWGKDKNEFSKQINRIEDVTPATINYLQYYV